MKYKAEISTAGLSSGVRMTIEEDLSKMVWSAEYRTNHELRLRRYAYFERPTKNFDWKSR